MSRFRVLAVLAVVAALGIGGLFGWQKVFGTTVHDTQRLANVVCGTLGAKVKNAAGYRSGTAPYGLAVFVQDSSGYTGTVVNDTAPNVTTLLDAQRSRQISDIQLVACVARDGGEPIGKNCEFDGGKSLPVYRSRYRVRVYEATTRHQVADSTVDAEPTVRFSCPATYFDGGGHKIYLDPDNAALAGVLVPLVR
jgi:hypothetical protein